jgi:transcription elongation factor GreA
VSLFGGTWKEARSMVAVGDALERVVLTDEGRACLEDKVRRLRAQVLPELLMALRDPDHTGTLDAEYERALDELSELSYALERAGSEDSVNPHPDVVSLLDEVTIEFADGERETVRIVHPIEASLDERRISHRSPLAEAILGRRVGEVVEVAAPGGRYRCTIVRTGRPAREVAET